MKTWLVVLSDRSHMADLRDAADVEWDSKYAPVAAIQATDEQAESLRALPWVRSVTEPQEGTFFAQSAPEASRSVAAAVLAGHPDVTGHDFDGQRTRIFVADAAYDQDLGLGVLEAVFAAAGPRNDFLIAPERDRRSAAVRS